jgi:hypothetical protein
LDLRASPGLLIERELVSERKDPELQCGPGPDHGSEAFHHGDKNGVHGEAPIEIS